MNNRVIVRNDFIANDPEEKNVFFHLINGMIKYDPKERSTIENVLNHPFFEDVKHKLPSTSSISGDSLQVNRNYNNSVIFF